MRYLISAVVLALGCAGKPDYPDLRAELDAAKKENAAMREQLAAKPAPVAIAPATIAPKPAPVIAQPVKQTPAQPVKRKVPEKLIELRPKDFEIGQAGKFTNEGIVDRGDNPGRYWSFRVVSILSDIEIVATLPGDRGFYFVAHGLKTAGLVDGKTIQLTGVWEVTGTRKIGGNTVFVVEKID